MACFVKPLRFEAATQRNKLDDENKKEEYYEEY